ncbi:hypothetical protein LTR64_008410 [Lithohypha guttulata]|uniref:uncharacterized protein n=1 Tax=Lithohypha guttulata TaxID=1690604 RepID=UPI002DDEB65B|nr:hypothetical protein LTR51_008545 [Lithohypha guttulata]
MSIIQGIQSAPVLLLTQQFQGYQPTPSRLLELPAEIRLKILRYLHKSSDPIRAGNKLKEGSRHTEANPNYADDVQLSAQALRVCRMLNREGTEVLYWENTLNLSCFSREGGDLLTLSTLDATAQLRLDTIVNSAHRPMLKETELDYTGLNGPTVYQKLSVINSFRMLELDMLLDDIDPLGVYTTVWYVRNIFHNKKLVIRFSASDLDEQDVAPMLSPLLGLRCARLEFSIQYHNQPRFFTVNERLTQRITDTVQSNEPVVTYHVDFGKVYQRIKMAERTGRRSFEGQYRQELEALTRSVCEYSGDDYLRLKKLIVGHVVAWSNRAAEVHRQELLASLARIDEDKRRDAKWFLELLGTSAMEVSMGNNKGE